jgi:predicted ribosome quality control (RQC) complex YloA/Tae2 family protein
VSDLNKLNGNIIEKIYNIDRNKILIKTKDIGTKQKNNIFINNGKLICITDKDFQFPIKPSTFIMTLRKYLINGRIVEVCQHEFDRIIKLRISKKFGIFTLIIEFFSQGNIILIDPNNKIIIPLISQTWKHRKIRVKETYLPPPSQINPFLLKINDFISLLKESDSDVVRTLAVNINLGGQIAEEICIRANIDKHLSIDLINNKTTLKLFHVFSDFQNQFKNKKFSPLLVKKDEEIYDIIPFKFLNYLDKNLEFQQIDNFAKGLSHFIKINNNLEKKGTTYDKLISKFERQYAQQDKIIKKLDQEIQLKKIEGDLIYLHFQEIKNLLEDIDMVLELKQKNKEIIRINSMDIVKSFNPDENILIVNLKDPDDNIFNVEINFRKSVSENAEKAYADNKKLKSKLNGAKKSIIKTKDLLRKAKEDSLRIKENEDKELIHKKEKRFWFERYRWFISSDGNIVISGMDKKSNEHVVKKYLKQSDRYAHADIQGAPSVIIKSRGVKDNSIEISDNTLEESCIFATCYSKAWKQFAEAQAYWVKPEQVSKSPQSGEFVPQGAFIIRGKRNYYRCKLEIAIGLITIDKIKKIMGGPISAVKKRTDVYFILNPGNTKKSDIAKKISKAFHINIELVEHAIPPGGSKIIEYSGVKL